MKATLTLDDDVAALLDVARRREGQSLERMGNDLLRRTLRRLRSRVSADAAEPSALASDGRCLEDEIDQLYGEIRDLVSRSAAEPALAGQLETGRQRLRQLQAEQAAIWARGARSGRQLQPGEGYQALERAQRWLDG